MNGGSAENAGVIFCRQKHLCTILVSMKLIIKYVAKPQHKDALEKELRSIILITRKAHGCVQCDLHTSMDDKLVFFFDQLWDSEENMQKYLKREHMLEFARKTELMIDIVHICSAEH